jgi:nitroreductase
MIKHANTKYPVDELIKKRWSPRAFTGEKISRENILTLFEAASWAASSRNEQPWRFIYGLKDEDESYQKIFDTLVLWNQKWAQSASVLALGIAKMNSDYHNKPNDYAWYDLGQAVATMAVQASSSGLYMHQMGGFDPDIARQLFNIPEGYKAVVAIAIGYLGKPEDLPEDMKDLETKERTRIPVEKLVFTNSFEP